MKREHRGEGDEKGIKRRIEKDTQGMENQIKGGERKRIGRR